MPTEVLYRTNKNFGIIIARLKELKLVDCCIVVFMGDIFTFTRVYNIV